MVAMLLLLLMMMMKLGGELYAARLRLAWASRQETTGSRVGPRLVTGTFYSVFTPYLLRIYRLVNTVPDARVRAFIFGRSRTPYCTTVFLTLAVG